MAVYPTIDVTCDLKRRTIVLTRPESTLDRIVATYVGPQDIAEGMLKAVECRLFIPGQKMSFRVNGEQSRADIIAFLRRVPGG